MAHAGVRGRGGSKVDLKTVSGRVSYRPFSVNIQQRQTYDIFVKYMHI